MRENETIAVIRRRRSVRSYQDRKLDREDVLALLEAGLSAPHGGDDIEEDIHFTVIESRGILDRINVLAKDAARRSGMEWIAELGRNEGYDCLYKAPALIVVSYRENSPCPETDCAAATQNMLIAAESLGLGACWLYFPLQAFSLPEGRELLGTFGLPDGFRPFSSLIAGFREGPAEVRAARGTRNVTYL